MVHVQLIKYIVGEDAGWTATQRDFTKLDIRIHLETCVDREIVSHTGPYHSSPCVQFKQLDGELIRAGMSILLRARPV